MTRSIGARIGAGVLALGLLAACSKAEDEDAVAGDDTQATVAAGEETEVDPELGEDLMWNDGPCDDTQDVVKVGLIAPFNAGAISLEDNAIAAEASAEAFNARGGIAGRCIEMVTCDDGGDPNQAADCARTMVSEGVVVQVNDSVIAAADVVNDILMEAGIPRLDGSPAPAVFGDPNIYTLGMGGLGNVVMTIPPLANAGATRFAIVRADVPGAAAMQGLMGPEAAAYGGEIVADIPVTIGTSDFSQFVIAADSAGADGVIMAVGRDEAIQVLRAAQQLDSDLIFSIPFGSLSRADVIEFGDFADGFVFNGDMPPASADPEPFPILAVAQRELEASGEPTMHPDALTTSAMKSWVYFYALISMVRDAGLTDITAASLTEMLNAATDVDMGGLTPPWTPNATDDGIFLRVSMPFYWTGTWDPETDNFVLDPEQVDSLAALAGEPPG